jgi:hypothetical protein
MSNTLEYKPSQSTRARKASRIVRMESKRKEHKAHGVQARSFAYLKAATAGALLFKLKTSAISALSNPEN